jgi:hypothetical protein
VSKFRDGGQENGCKFGIGKEMLENRYTGSHNSEVEISAAANSGRRQNCQIE